METAGVPREMALIVAGAVAPHVGEQFRAQASQLAGHLRAKQQQIDHREAYLNARIAQLEREVRTSRLWCAEREYAFAEREQQLEQEILESRKEIQAFSASEVSTCTELDEHRAEVREREADLDAREHRWRTGQMQVADEAESLRVAVERLRAERAKHEREVTAAQQQLEYREAQSVEQRNRLLANLTKHRISLDHQEKHLSQQRTELGIRGQAEIVTALQEQQEAFDTAATLLDEQRTTLQDERDEFEALRDTALEALSHERESFEHRKEETEKNFMQLRDKMNARQATLDQRRGSLEQTKQQVFELHREAIEMRMVAEQLWQHAAKGKPVAELTQSLGKLRAQLADEFRVSQDELTGKEQHLRELAGKLDARQQQLKEQRANLNQWLERRNAGIEEQAARLVARDLELDTQQQEIREREAAWRSERSELQTRLRQLTRQLRPHAPAAA
ncbi:MAG: hypothetical protein H8E66_29785 [Planctomycetes bacterium]|nr:hypothetical protein [Planctomycetota bacterium]